MKKSDFDKFVFILLISYIITSNLKSFIDKSDKKHNQSSFVKNDNHENIQRNSCINNNINKLMANNRINIKFSNSDIDIKQYYLRKYANNNSYLNISINKYKNNKEFNFNKIEFATGNLYNNFQIGNENNFVKNIGTRSRLSKHQQQIIKNYLIKNRDFIIQCANKQECVINIPFLGVYGIFDIIDKVMVNNRLKNFIIQFAYNKGINEFFGITLDNFFSILDQTCKQYGYNPVTHFSESIKSCSKREYILHVNNLIDRLSS